MTVSVSQHGYLTALRRAAVRATYAPSVHNTQPWRLHITPEELRIYADRARGLPVLDPTSRQMTISIGCALFNARVALASDNIAIEVTRLPDPLQPDLIANIRPVEGSADRRLAALDHTLEQRQTSRRRFATEQVPDELLAELETAAASEDGVAHIVRNPDDRVAVAVLSQRADDIENLNPAYRAELRAWTTDNPGRRDGVPLRGCDTSGSGGLPPQAGSSINQCLVLLCTRGDSPLDWLRAGEALERVFLEIARHGFAASPSTQATEVPSVRASLRDELGLVTYPHVLVRIGGASITPASRRRRLIDVLTEDS